MTDLITLPRATVQQALEALKCLVETYEMGNTIRADIMDAEEAITALKAALEQPEQAEPVAWRTFDGEGGYDYRTYDDNENYRDEWDRRNPNHKGWVEPLYTHPPRREPLSDEELDRLWREPMSADWEHREYGRAIEAAHGIKEKT